ncbi:MAG TPA: LOG family protein [Aggregatilineaceae bacterium]|nr:LOG family protein [Aggregatilineaceae bacterium]
MEEKLTQNARMVAVFGSAGVTPETDDWKIAYTLGQQLAQAGYVVLSGGYSGVMEACSQGACEIGGHVVGTSVALFESRGLRVNGFVREEVAFETLRDRLFFLVQKPDAFVVLRGGVGTLSEISLVWSLLQVGELAARPFVLVGPMWRSVVDVFAQHAAISPNDLRWLTLVDTVDQVVPALGTWWAAPPDVPLRLGDVTPS